MSYSAQNSLSIKRLRNGDSLFLSLSLNGKPLYQAIDEQTGGVTPDWTVAANQPVITPEASSVRGMTVILSGHTWRYNGTALAFTGATSEGFTTDSTGKFALNPTTGALKIIKNLASEDNIASDTLMYSCTATVAGVEYSLSKSVDVQIQKCGASSYYGFLNASTTQLDADTTSATITSELWLAAAPVGSFHVVWYKDDEKWTAKAGQKTITVTRDDINGCQLFVAEFYLDSSDVNYVFRAGIMLVDTMDEIMLVPYISSSNKEVDSGMPVTVAARIVKTSTGAVLTPSNPTWKFTIMDGDTWDVLEEGAGSSIQVSTAHTDKADGSQHDVEVLVEVTFDSLT